MPAAVSRFLTCIILLLPDNMGWGGEKHDYLHVQARKARLQDKRLTPSHVDGKRQEADLKSGSADSPSPTPAAFHGARGAFREHLVPRFSALATHQSHQGFNTQVPWSHPRPASERLWGWGPGPLGLRAPQVILLCTQRVSHWSSLLPSVSRRI